MATVAGVELGLEDRALKAGAAFRLSTPEIADTTIEVGDGEVVRIGQEHRVVIVSLRKPVIVRDTGYLQAHDAAQRALDLLNYTGAGTALITEDAQVQWWRGKD